MHISLCPFFFKILRTEQQTIFFASIWLLFLSWIIFCRDGFDGEAGNTSPHTSPSTCCGGVTWYSLIEATSYFNCFIYCSKFFLLLCVFPSSGFDVAEAVDLCLSWSRLFWLFIRSSLAIDVSASFCNIFFAYFSLDVSITSFIEDACIGWFSPRVTCFSVKLQSMFQVCRFSYSSGWFIL